MRRERYSSLAERKVDQQSPHHQRKKVEQAHQDQIKVAEFVLHFPEQPGLGRTTNSLRFEPLRCHDSFEKESADSSRKSAVEQQILRARHRPNMACPPRAGGTGCVRRLLQVRPTNRQPSRAQRPPLPPADRSPNPLQKKPTLEFGALDFRSSQFDTAPHPCCRARFIWNCSSSLVEVLLYRREPLGPPLLVFTHPSSRRHCPVGLVKRHSNGWINRLQIRAAASS